VQSLLPHKAAPTRSIPFSVHLSIAQPVTLRAAPHVRTRIVDRHPPATSSTLLGFVRYLHLAVHAQTTIAASIKTTREKIIADILCILRFCARRTRFEAARPCGPAWLRGHSHHDAMMRKGKGT
jgi:hypothetical protein